MRNKILLFFSFLLIISCKKKEETSIIKFNNNVNFGIIKVGDTIEKEIEIVNISEIPLKIKRVESSCGCTVAKLKDSLIQKDEVSKINVKFIASSDKIGKIQNTIVIEANTKPNYNVIYFEGEVIKK